MYSNYILYLMIAASASSILASKDFLRNDPLLGGSVIKYCEKESPNTCETIDRRKEALPKVNRIDSIKQIGTKIGEVSADFSSISYENEAFDFSVEFKQEKLNK